MLIRNSTYASGEAFIAGIAFSGTIDKIIHELNVNIVFMEILK